MCKQFKMQLKIFCKIEKVVKWSKKNFNLTSYWFLLLIFCLNRKSNQEKLKYILKDFIMSAII